tara:strand:+ start:555 stop:1280 length:726 start_codon:yes stop_codon:yes gene_type:complete
MLNLSQFSSFFIANWKLNGNLSFIKEYIHSLNKNSSNTNCVVICPPAIYLNNFKDNTNHFYLGAQDISKFEKGAFTGEISAKSLTDFGVNFCIVGHSERRHYFNENDELVKEKALKLLENEIIPIICVGETLEEKKNNKTIDVITNQILNGIPPESNDKNTIIAYEPVWAIGSGLTPSIDEIDIVHKSIRDINKNINNYKIIYGGSVNSKNSKDIISLSNVDGALIGGASLKIDDFNNIIT